MKTDHKMSVNEWLPKNRGFQLPLRLCFQLLIESLLRYLKPMHSCQGSRSALIETYQLEESGAPQRKPRYRMESLNGAATLVMKMRLYVICPITAIK